MFSIDDTACAAASAHGVGGRGIVRASGPRVAAIVEACFRASEGILLSGVRTASCLRGVFELPPPLGPIDCDLLYWPDTRSYTRQPTVEIHTFGSPPILAAIVRTLCEKGARPAEPGEFTLRAFLAGRIDLTQAEAVLGVIDAVDGNRLQAALAQLAGGMSRPLAELREQLLVLLADLEAGLDFVEEDIEFVSHDSVERKLLAASVTMQSLLARLGSRATASNRAKVVLTGLPNVGKSSLFNALVGRANAIVSNQPGTTRDLVSAVLDLDGLECELIDTAGVDDAPASPIESDAQGVAAQALESADVIVNCRIVSEDAATGHQSPSVRALEVLTQCDRSTPRHTTSGLQTSALTGEGIAELRAALRQVLSSNENVETSFTGTAERCRDSLTHAAAAIDAARQLNVARAGEELVAAELRLALSELGKVAGSVYTDDILDRIFSRFCIGK